MLASDFENTLHVARAGDREALHQLLCDHFDRLQRHVAYRAGDHTELSPDDILQETFVHAVRDIRKCQATTAASFFSWLKNVADNRMRDALKSSAAKKRGGGYTAVRAVKVADASSLQPLIEMLAETSDTPSVGVAGDEAVKAVQVALSSLPDDQREAITLKHIHGLELDAVADQLGRTPAAVRGLIHRGKQTLRAALGNSSRWFSKK